MDIPLNTTNAQSLMPIVNPADVESLLNSDPLFISIHNLYGPPPNWSRPEGFISLSKIILEQQVSLASANAHFIKLNEYLPEFTPDEMIKLTDEEIRACQISRQKAKYLRALSNNLLTKDLDLEAIRSLEEMEVRKKLTAVKGIGEWTADIYLMFCLQAKDIFPIGDIAVVNTIKELTAVTSKVEILQRADAWRPYRSLASFFCWHYYLKKRNRSTV